jgi:hypothetical protein
VKIFFADTLSLEKLKYTSHLPIENCLESYFAICERKTDIRKWYINRQKGKRNDKV